MSNHWQGRFTMEIYRPRFTVVQLKEKRRDLIVALQNRNGR